MKKQTLWTIVLCIAPLSLLFLLNMFKFGEIANDLILFSALLIILLIFPGDFEDSDADKAINKITNHANSHVRQFAVNPKSLGLSIGLTFVLLHVGCIFIMYYLGHDGTVSFFNNMFHGMDFSTVVRMDVPFTEMLAGSIELFIAGTFIGFCIAGFYNLFLKSR